MTKTIFNDEDKANAFLVDCRWPKGIKCAYCDSDSISKHREKGRSDRYQCDACNRSFSVLTGTFLHYIKNKAKWLLFIRLTNNKVNDRNFTYTLGLGVRTYISKESFTVFEGVYSASKVSEALSVSAQTVKKMEERIYLAKKRKDKLLASIIHELSYVNYS